MRHKLPKDTAYRTGPCATVYRVHCLTWAIARDMTGATNCARIDMGQPLTDQDSGGTLTFRALPAYRSPAAKRLRTRVAGRILAQRRDWQ